MCTAPSAPSRGFWSVVLLGRVVFVVGLRAGARDSGRLDPLMDVAVAAMSVGVALEIATYAVATAAAVLADDQMTSAVRAANGVSFELEQMLVGPTGVAVLCAGIVLRRSALVPRVPAVLGVVGGVVLVLTALTLGAPSMSAAMDAATSVVLLVWVWMVWLGVLFWRRTPGRAADRPEQVATPL